MRYRETEPPAGFVSFRFLETRKTEYRIWLEKRIYNINIQARYPEYKSQLAQILNQKECRYIIDTTKELQSWIKSKL